MVREFDIKANLDVFKRRFSNLLTPPMIIFGIGVVASLSRHASSRMARLLSLTAAVLAGSLLLGGAGPAFAVTYTFTQLHSDGSSAIGDQLTVDVEKSGSDAVTFTFYNDVGLESSITDIYLSGTDGLLILPGEITEESAGVSFSTGADPSNLPGGMTYDFYATTGADSDAPVYPNGVDSAEEYVTWTFLLASGMTYEDVVGAIEAGNLQVGLRAPGSSGGSSSFINNVQTPSVPLPASIWLMFGALGGLAFLARRGRPDRTS